MTKLTSMPEMLITTYLEMTHYEQFKPAYVQQSQIKIERWQGTDLDFYLSLYKGVGYELRWRDRLIMPPEQLAEALAKAYVYVLYYAGEPAGYVELDKQGDDVEVAYFGLFAQFQGLGLGKHLLSYGIEQAWQIGAKRVFVHTCNLDGEHAMSNYEKRGFQAYHQHSESMPERYKT
jgi:GNAT superfamily N-acetyltransferase